MDGDVVDARPPFVFATGAGAGARAGEGELPPHVVLLSMARHLRRSFGDHEVPRYVFPVAFPVLLEP